MICDGCKREVPSNVKFCPSCGKAVSGQNPSARALTCPKCGATYPEGTRFCRIDGQPLQPAATPPADAARKPAATPPVAPLPIPPAAASPALLAPPAGTSPVSPAPAAAAPVSPAAPSGRGPTSPAMVVPRKTPLVVYGVALVVLLVVGCLVWFLFLRRPAPSAVSEQARVTESGGAPVEAESPGTPAGPKGAAPTGGEGKPAAPVMVVTEQPQAREAEQPRQEKPAVVEPTPAPEAIPPCAEDICIEVSNGVCSPARAAVGAEVHCAAGYTLVQSRDKEPIEIEESAHFDGARKATATQRVQRTSGRNRLAINFVVPKGTKPGAYQVTLKARRRGTTGSADASLTIE